MTFKIIRILLIFTCFVDLAAAQNRGKINWTADGNYYTRVKEGNIVQVDPGSDEESVLIKKAQLTDPVTKAYLTPQSYTCLLYTSPSPRD